MIITFKELTLKNYKSHQDLVVNFGEVTKITGDNAKGKSSILEAACWLLYGKSIMGSKVDPTPVTYEANETSVSLLFNEGEKDLLLTRILVKGKAEYAINDTPKKATEFNELVEEYFEKALFLSLFNPLYYFTLNWTVQRAMLMQYVPDPIKKDVLEKLSKVEKEALEPLLKKKSLEDLEAEHKKNKTKKEKEYIAAQATVNTLKNEKVNDESFNVVSVEQELNDAKKRLLKSDDMTQEMDVKNSVYRSKAAELERERDILSVMKERYMKIYNDEIKQDCPTCERPLDEESIASVTENREKELAAKREEFKEQQTKVNTIKDHLKEIEHVDVSEHREKARALSDEVYRLQKKLDDAKRTSGLSDRLKKAIKHESDTEDSLKESVFILDTIKSFRAKEADLQVENVQALFDTLSVRLFDEQKNGEQKPTFVIQMDGKDFNKLSLSESIRAGIELREVLSKQSEVIAPCFVDNAESITRYKGPSGQLITSTVVPEKELEVVAE